MVNLLDLTKKSANLADFFVLEGVVSVISLTARQDKP